ncbi:DUF3592 domain-containing protein [Luteipulveratus flavus]|uniref:DUF3592 domain-containing protein n=1 Tax=Luteipulveratus flavus TaxID=3031728 RepID=A0ABT6C9V9_9MICO|nr:DUF3592 domain-containing protein [Luteipulveratus sp. YIM 133296]MDF8265658.1 DUF3592 domain-containing protein [Luteipulveratus sp. YIM 133296]
MYGDPIIMVAPFLVAAGLFLLLRFGWKLFGMVQLLRRRRAWEQTPAFVTGVSMKQGRESSQVRGGVVHAGLLVSNDAWTVHYTYGVGDTEHEGTSPWRTTPPPVDGDVLTVSVDPHRPSRSAFLEVERPGLVVVGYSLAILVGVALIVRSILAFTHIGRL